LGGIKLKTISLKISELRKEKGLSQRDLAEYLGVSFQSVSKWENEVTMPDITLLPMLSEFFGVSVDELLGLKPLNNREYIKSQTDSKDFWSNKLNYLEKNKMFFWNDDYLEFLVKNVWKIDQPVNILDFGCGYGYLGRKLLPLLPQGSTYTGLDINEYFIEQAKEYFSHTTYPTFFQVCDLYDYIPEKVYDIVICQAVLRHLSKPWDILQKMADSAAENGLVACIEVNREFENAGLYLKGMDYHSLCTDFDYHKLWDTELVQDGRDYAAGIRIPFYLQELGLHDIDVRINDRVLFLHPGQKNYEALLQDFITANDWDRPLGEKDKEALIAWFMNRGLTRSEAEAFLTKQFSILEHLDKNKDRSAVLKTLCLVISYGRK
jgi:transcriptional regulator with XRE-family HTH domain